MKKRKSKAVVFSATGDGGVFQIQDRRFQPGDWRVHFEVPLEQADTWLKYLESDCRKRNWPCSNFAALDAKENSGTVTVRTDNPQQGELTIVWERKRGGPLRIRARADKGFPTPLMQQLFERVSQQCAAAATETVYVRGLLEYEGLPWRGELWLDEMLRLGPPSRQDEEYLVSQRIVVVDALVNAIDVMDAATIFPVRLRELGAFLSIVTRTHFQIPGHGRSWTFSVDEDGKPVSEIRNRGYIEPEPSSGMPLRGTHSSVPLVAMQRPDFAIRGITGQESEQAMPADITDLWRALKALSPDLRQQFFQVASLSQLSRSIAADYPTAAFALMVSAVEALKPSRQEFREHTIYHVVQSLLGKPVAELLNQEWFQAQKIRNAHFHWGEFRGSEFSERAMMSTYHDPTFDHARRTLAIIASSAIVG
jgi:hypothetical protein